MWRLIKYFAEAGEPRERAEPQPPPARCSLPGGGAGWAGSAPRLGSPGLGRALPQPSHRTTRLLPVDRALRRPVPPSPPKSGTVSSLPCAPTHQSQAGREDGAGRAGLGGGGMPTPDAPGGETPAFPLPEARGGVSPRPRGQPRGRALPSARREPGAVAAFKVCFWSVLWFAGEKACLQTAASELPRRGEEARLCQRRTKPPEFLQTFLGVLGRRKKKYNIYIGAFSLLALPLARLNLNPSLPPPPSSSLPRIILPFILETHKTRFHAAL